MENEDYDVSTIDKFRLTYDGPDLEIIERIRRMYERVPFGKSKDVDDEEEGGGRKKRRRKKLKFLVRFREDLEFRRKFILTLGLLWSFMILVSVKLRFFFVSAWLKRWSDILEDAELGASSLSFFCLA